MTEPALLPELYVSDFPRSVAFYTRVIGFQVRYDSPEERFAYLTLGTAALMLEEPTRPERTLLAAEPTPPYGRGMNLSVTVPDVHAVYARERADSAADGGPLVPAGGRGGREPAVRGAGPGRVRAAAGAGPGRAATGPHRRPVMTSGVTSGPSKPGV